MTYVPVVPAGGFAGWAYLQRTREAQLAAHSEAPAVARETTRFTERIGSVTSASELVEDRDLLAVALGAFGLSDDLPNRRFIEQVLKEGVAQGSLASRLSDARYRDLAAAFDFRSTEPGLVEELLEGYTPRTFAEFEAARDGDDRAQLEMVVAREVETLALATTTDANGEDVLVAEDARWLSLVSAPATYNVLKYGLNLPAGFDSLSREAKVQALRSAAERVLGQDPVTPAIERLATPEGVAQVVDGFYTAIERPTARDGFADRIVALYEARGFEAAVGEQDPDMRLMLNLERELPKLAARDASTDTLWFTIMGTPPLRQVFETAFGLPSSFGTLDVDQQLDVFKEQAQRAFGDEGVAQFADPDKIAELGRQFLARSQIAQGQGALSSGSIAVSLLSGLVPQA